MVTLKPISEGAQDTRLVRGIDVDTGLCISYTHRSTVFQNLYLNESPGELIMQEVNVHEAQTQLPLLLTQVEAGEEIVITRNGKPVARLVDCQPGGKRRFGAWKDRIAVDDSFFDPLSEEELSAWES